LIYWNVNRLSVTETAFNIGNDKIVYFNLFNLIMLFNLFNCND